MKTISVQQPWAWLIMAALKKVENRSWPTDYRGRLAIHASSQLAIKSWSEILEPDGNEPVAVAEEVELADGMILPALVDLPLSAILGTVELVDCVRDTDLPPDLQDHSFAGVDCWCWVLRDPRPLDQPFPCKGKLRLWNSPPELKLS